MIFLDYSIESCKCPICRCRLLRDEFAVCTRYSCNAHVYSINRKSFPHYEFMRYKDDSVFFQYVLPPIQIMSSQNDTTIYWLDKLNNFTKDYSARELASNKSTLFLVNENVDEIKKKIKLYTLFS